MVALRSREAPKQDSFIHIPPFDAQYDNQGDYECDCRHDQKCGVTEGEGQEFFHGQQT